MMPGPRSGDQQGTTLVELLITVTIVGIAVVGLLGAIANAVVESDINRDQARASALLRSSAEQAVYVACPATTPPPISVPAGFQAIVAIAHLNPATNSFQPTCPIPDAGVERFTIRVGSNDRRASETLQVIVRDASR